MFVLIGRSTREIAGDVTSRFDLQLLLLSKWFPVLKAIRHQRMYRLYCKPLFGSDYKSFASATYVRINVICMQILFP